MKWRTLSQTALINLRVSKLRSFLALLGIMVGTASVVALMSLGLLATEKALEQFRTLGTDLLSVAVFPQNGPTEQSGRAQNLSLAAWQSVSQAIPDISQFAPYNTTYQPTSFHGYPIKGAIIGSDERLAPIIHIEMAAGRFVSYFDTYEQTCVIGANIAEQMRTISLADPIGQSLRLGNALYTIIGVTQPWKENAFFNDDVNQAIIIPIASVSIINQKATINNAIMRLAPKANIDDTISNLQQLIKAQSPNINVFVRSAKHIIQNMENQGHIFTLLLVIIGGIALLVGGVGIMNVMLVSVSERKKEIGIRKACGSTKHNIQALFLIESLYLSLLGGVLGVLTGILVTALVAYFNHWPFQLFYTPIAVGFFASATTGIFFGFYPARRAAEQEAIASLRGE